jgi:hypothetical protein
MEGLGMSEKWMVHGQELRVVMKGGPNIGKLSAACKVLSNVFYLNKII